MILIGEINVRIDFILEDSMAESEGFEPSIRYRIHTFQACAFGHSASSPLFGCSRGFLNNRI